MPNPMYVDEMAEQHGTVQDLPVLIHPHTVTVPHLPWQADPWAAVTADHGPLLHGQSSTIPWKPCHICGKRGIHHVGGDWTCAACQRNQARAERSAAERDASMGVAKLVTPR